MTDKQILVDWDDGLKKFKVTAPFFANDLVKLIPSVRWDKRRRTWIAPATRMNAEYLEKGAIAPYCEYSREVRSVCKYIRDKHVESKAAGYFPTWYKFKVEPRPYQHDGLAKLYPLKAAAYHMDRGTGKSMMLIHVASARRTEGKIGALLLVCRLSTRRNWLAEIEKHSPIPWNVRLPESDRPKEWAKWIRGVEKLDFPVIIIGTESLSHPKGKIFEWAQWFMRHTVKPMMAIDESHHFSSHKAIRSDRVVELGAQAEYRAALTGTPMSTGPMNLYMQFEFLDTDIIGIGDYYAFRNRYALMGGYMREVAPGKKIATQIVGYQNLEELTRLVAPYTFQVLKKDVLSHLPPKVYSRRYVKLHPAQRALYDKIRKDKMYEFKGKEVSISNVLELALRLHQVVGGHTVSKEINAKGRTIGTPEWVVPWTLNPKIKELGALIESEPDKQMVIWCAYLPEVAAVIGLLQKIAPGRGIGEITGRIHEDDRWASNRQFQKSDMQYLVANAASGGEGLEFTAAEIMVYLSNTQKSVDREQSEDRAHRSGLKHSVLYVDLIAEKTVDEDILQALADKRDLSDYIRERIRNATGMVGL